MSAELMLYNAGELVDKDHPEFACWGGTNVYLASEVDTALAAVRGELRRTRDELRARDYAVAALTRDAERYWFIRKWASSDEQPFIDVPKSPEHCDELIDAALSLKPSTGEG